MRYFYTDPLAAAWMAKHFGMEFEERPDIISGYSIVYCAEEFKATPPYYIHPDSLYLLKPNEGDIFIRWTERHDDPTDWRAMHYDNSNTRYWVTNRPSKIIYRNGVSFMWPENDVSQGTGK